MTATRATRAAVLLAAVLVCLSCDRAAGPTPPITMVLSAPSFLVIPGEWAPGPGYSPPNFNFEVHRNGFQGEIVMSVDAPDPINASVFLGPLDSTTAIHRSSVDLDVPAGTAPGNYEVTIRASTFMDGSVSARFTVTVQPFRMWLGHPSLTVNRGGMNTLSVRFDGSSQGVALSVLPHPAGVTITESSSGGGRYLDIAAVPNAPIQARTLFVKASLQGYEETREFRLTVQNAPPKRMIAFRMCWNQLGAFTSYYQGQYAFANDGEPWTPIVPDADDVIRISATERLRIANRFNWPGFYAFGPFTRVIEITATELEQMQCPSASRGSKTFAVTVDSAQQFDLAIGTFKAWRLPPMAAPARHGLTRSGPHDLIVAGTRPVPSGYQQVGVVRRALDLVSGDTLAIDFTSAEAVPLDSSTLPSEVTSATVRLHTATTIGLVSGRSTQAGGWYWALPESLLAAGDVQSLAMVGQSPGSTRAAVYYFRAPTPVTVSLGPPVAQAVVDAQANTISLPSQPEYPDLAGVGQRRTLDYRGIHEDVEVWRTKAFAGGTPATWVFSMPDLGRFAAMPRVAGGAASAAAAAGSASLFFGGTPPVGSQLLWAGKNAGNFALFLPFPVAR